MPIVTIYKKKRRKRRGRRRKARRYRAIPSVNYHRFRLTNVFDLKTDKGGSLAGACNYWFKDHDLLKTIVRHTSTGVVTVGGLSDVNPSLINMFDSYRVKFCRIKYTPRYGKGQWVEEGNALTGIPAVYISHDPDNVNLLQDRTRIVKKVNAKRFDMSMPWQYTWRPKRMSMTKTAGVDVQGNGWINLQSTAFPAEGETQLSTTPFNVANPSGIAPFEDSTVGEILLEYFVEFKSRK